jgi:hypothetical protein
MFACLLQPISASGQSRRLDDFRDWSGVRAILKITFWGWGDGMNVIQAPKLEPRITRHELSTANGASSDRCPQISHAACRVWTIGLSGAPGEKDEACSKAGIDKVADQLK